MTAWIFSAIVVLLFMLSVALFSHYDESEEVCAFARKIAKWILSISAFFFTCVIILLSTFSYTSEFFNSAFSVGFISNSRVVLKVLFGSESVFASLQMIGAISLFLFSFASFAVCICCVSLFLLRKNKCSGNYVDNYSEKEVSRPVAFLGRPFVWLSRYLL